jgi:myo-inositol 2-dehydrogenase / D-chiro-inositol 1-dehydrogenase
VKDLRVGVAGAGFIATPHVNAYAVQPGVQVVGVADAVLAKAERLAAEVGALACASFDQLLDLDLDVVSICTPPATHARLSIQALEAGLHVLCEKPLARDLPDGRSIVAAARSAPGILMVGQVSRYEPDHRAARQAIDDGLLGEVRMMSHSMTTSMPGWSQGGWLSDFEQAGGALVDLGIHSLDFLSWCAGSEPVRVHAVGADTAIGSATYMLTTVRYANGALGLVESSWAHPVSHGFRLATEIVGTGGRLSWDYDSISGGVVNRSDGSTRTLDPLGDRGFRAEIGSFIEAVRTGAASPVPPEQALTALRTALAALASRETGTVIDLTRWGMP